MQSDNPKGDLNIYFQNKFKTPVTYKTERCAGKHHTPTWNSQCFLPPFSKRCMVLNVAGNKKQAEQHLAKIVLSLIENIYFKETLEKIKYNEIIILETDKKTGKIDLTISTKQDYADDFLKIDNNVQIQCSRELFQEDGEQKVDCDIQPCFVSQSNNLHEEKYTNVSFEGTVCKNTNNGAKIKLLNGMLTISLLNKSEFIQQMELGKKYKITIEKME